MRSEGGGAKPGLGWTLRMAWRDGRRQWRKLMLCMVSIVFGVAALVAVQSLGDNLKVAIDNQSKTLLGADLLFSSPAPFSKRSNAFFKRFKGEQSREVRFTSMASFLKQEATRLVLVRAMDGGFPFYGELETEPPGLSVSGSERPVALVDDSLMIQFDLKAGDSVQLGEQVFEIVGSVKKVPGESGFSGLFAPRVYIPERFLEATGLLGFGSVVRYRAYFELPDGIDQMALNEGASKLFGEEQLRFETVESRKQNLGKVLDNVYRFLKLVGFVALLLGAIGIAGSVHVYLQDKIASVAVLRCLGVSRRQSFFIFWLQVMTVSVGGALLGVLLGVSFQSVLPRLLGAFLPFELESFVSWSGILIGFSMGCCVALLFSLIPMLPVRKVTALRALRSQVEGSYSFRGDALFWVLLGFIVFFLLVFSVVQSAVWWHGVAFCGGLLVAFGFLYGLAWLLRAGLKRIGLARRSFVWRQGIKNLYRPNNRTLFIVVALGLGTFLVYTLYLVEHALLKQTNLVGREDEPNVLFFDVQWDQRDGLHQLVKDAGYAIVDEAPVVTMRLAKIKERTTDELRTDPNTKIERWILNREWRATYRDSLKSETETVIEGEFVEKWDAFDEPIPISLEEGMAEDLSVGLNDSITFDVQGIELETVVSSIRKVDWQRMRSNFFTVFPAGVLEDAPTFYIAFTKTDGSEQTALLQRKVVQAFPNVTSVDLGLILDTVSRVLDRITYVLRFMGSFTIITGLVVLGGAVITSRYQRAKESVLLRTIGASSRQVRGIIALEYIFLGILSGVAGVLLSVLAAWGLGHFVFKVDVNLPWISIPVVVVVIACLTTLIGLFNSRGISTRTPLDALRSD